MAFTFSDISSVVPSLHGWEIGEYVSEGLVIIACAGELIADLGEKWLGERRKKHVERWSTLLLVLALAASLKCIMRTNELSGTVIGSLGDMAEQADTKAKTAISDSSTALSQAKDALGKAGKAEEKASAADATALSARHKAAKLDEQLSATKQKLNDVEGKRAELETSLKNLATCTAPRVIPVWSIGTKTGGRRYNDPLLPFHDWSVMIEYVPNDAETQRAATSLARAFEFAGWRVTLKASGRSLADGVKVQGWEPDFAHATDLGMPDMESARAAQETAGVAVKFLHSYDWQATLGWMEQDDVTRKLVPPKGILIEIGLYPPVWYVAPPAMKYWSAAMAEQKKEEAEKEQKALKAQKESDDKILSQQLPQMEEIFRRDFEEGRAQQEQLRKESEELHSSPCQPLETLGPYN